MERTGWSDRRNIFSGFARACASHISSELTTPSARNKVATRLLIDRAATPPLRGGECPSLLIYVALVERRALARNETCVLNDSAKFRIVCSISGSGGTNDIFLDHDASHVIDA